MKMEGYNTYSQIQAQWRLRDFFGRIPTASQKLSIPLNGNLFNSNSKQQIYDLLATIIGLDSSGDDGQTAHLHDLIQRIDEPTFSIVPLVLVIGANKASANFEESLLVKTIAENGTRQYLDMNGRLYLTMEEFLLHNQLPRGILCYSNQEEVPLEEDHGVRMNCCEVGRYSKYVSILDGVVAAFNCIACGGLLMIGYFHPVFSPMFRLVLGIVNLYLAGRATFILWDLLQYGGFNTLRLEILNCGLIFVSLLSFAFLFLPSGTRLWGMYPHMTNRVVLGCCLGVVLLWLMFQT